MVQHALRVSSPLHETFADRAAVGHSGIHRDQARKAARSLAQHSYSEQAAPVLAKQRGLLEVKLLYETSQPARMRAITVGIVVDRFVRTSEANQVRHDHAPDFGQRRDHPAIEVAPGRFSAQHQNRLAGTGSKYAIAAFPIPRSEARRGSRAGG